MLWTGATAIVQVFVSGTDEMEFANDFLPILLAVVSSHRMLWVTATRWLFREQVGIREDCLQGKIGQRHTRVELRKGWKASNLD